MMTLGRKASAQASRGKLEEGSAGLLMRNTVVSAVGAMSGILVTLLLTPFMIHRLGADAYAVWVLALTLTVAAGYFSLTDIGAQQAACRFIADARRLGDRAEENRVYSTTFALFLVVAAVFTAALIPAAPLLAGAFSIDGPLQNDASIAFQIIAVQLVFDLPGLAFRAMLEGAQKFVVLRAIDLLRVLLQAGAIVVLLLLGQGVVPLALSSLLVATAASGAMAVAAHWREPSIQLRPSLVSLERLRHLMTFGGALFVIRIASVLYRQMDRVLIAIFLSVTLVTTYEIANKIQGAAVLVATMTSAALLPAATFMRGDRARLRELFLRGTSYTVALTVPVAIAGMIYAHPLVVGWVGDEFSDAVSPTRLFLAWLLAGAFDMIGSAILLSLGRLRQVVWLNLAWVALNLALSLALIHPLEINGVILATVISYTLLTVAYTRLFLSEFDVSLAEWFRRVVVPNLPGAGVQVALGLSLLPLIEGLPDLVGALAAGAATVGASLAVYLFVGLRAPERAQLLSVVRTAFGRGPGAAADSATP